MSGSSPCEVIEQENAVLIAEHARLVRTNRMLRIALHIKGLPKMLEDQMVQRLVKMYKTGNRNHQKQTVLVRVMDVMYDKTTQTSFELSAQEIKTRMNVENFSISHFTGDTGGCGRVKVLNSVVGAKPPRYVLTPLALAARIKCS